MRARLVEDEVGGGDVPVVGVGRGHRDVEIPGGDLREPQRERRHFRLGDHVEFPRHRIDQEARSGEFRCPRHAACPRFHAPAVEKGAAAEPRGENLVYRGGIEHGGDRPAVGDERHRNGEARIALHEGARPVDRIDDEHRPPGEPVRRVGGFLGQPPGLRKQGGEPRLQQPVHGQIDLRDGRIARLPVDAAFDAGAVPEMAHGQLAGLAYRGGEPGEARVTDGVADRVRRHIRHFVRIAGHRLWLSVRRRAGKAADRAAMTTI